MCLSIYWLIGFWGHNTNCLCNRRTDEKKKVPFHLPETATVCINGSPGCSAAGFYEAIFLFNNTTHIALSKSWCADQSLTLAGPWERQLHALEIKTKSIISVLKFCHFCTIDLQKKKKKSDHCNSRALYEDNFTFPPGHWSDQLVYYAFKKSLKTRNGLG